MLVRLGYKSKVRQPSFAACRRQWSLIFAEELEARVLILDTLLHRGGGGGGGGGG